jgi:hypothetical protein
MSQNTLDILLSELFDYAGMFPPAALSFESAVRESTMLRSELKRPWLLGNDLVLDISSAQKLASKSPHDWGYSRTPSICLLATEAGPMVLSVCSDLLQKRATEPSRYAVASIEARCTADSINGIIETFSEYCSKHRIILALEPNLSGAEWRSELDVCLKRITHNSAKPGLLALKVRCGGDTAITRDKAPSIIEEATARGVNLKLTGGLHHPVIEADRYGNTFGFLTFTAAVMFRRALGAQFTIAQCARLLASDSMTSLTFGETVGFEEHTISSIDVVKAKNSALFTIGTCSLREPDDDLVRLLG